MLPSSLRLARDKSAYYRMRHLEQRAGMSRASSPAPQPTVPFETALVTTGQETGTLDDVYRLLADYFDAEDRAIRQVMAKAAYPFFCAFAAAFIAPFPLAWAGQTRAYLVAVFIGVGGLVLGAGALLAAIARWYLARPKYVRGRLLRALTIAIEAGLPLGRSVELAAAASGDADVVAHVRRVGARATQQPLADTLRGCPYVDFQIIAALEVAEASGDYSNTLRKLAELIEG